MFKVKKIDNREVYYSDILNIEHFFTTRQLIVKDNIESICNYLDIPKENLIKPNQTHSTNVELVDSKKEYKDCDALILNKTNHAIYLNFADCTPIILYDEKNNIASIAHAGWRGTAGRIAPKTIYKMQSLFNSNPKDIIALIGPCISFKHFETSPDAINQLKQSINTKPTPNLFNNNYANLKEINKQQLLESGIKEEKIDTCPFCTIDDNDKFFSYRKESQTPNRHSAVVKL